MLVTPTETARPAEVQLNRWLPFTLICVGVLLRVFFFFIATNNGGDALARAGTTAQWLQHPSLDLDFGGPNWPPIHFWMMAAVSSVVRSVAVGSRLLSLLFGAFSVWVVWRLARHLYGIQGALLSLICFDFYSLHIGYSTTSSSEAVYLGLLLAALLCFFVFRRSGNLRLLVFSGLILTVDAGIRYESWVFIFLMVLALIFEAISSRPLTWAQFRNVVVFGVAAGIWPVFWMIHEWKLQGNPLYAISNNYNLVPQQLAINPSHAHSYQWMLPPGVLLLTLTPLAILGGLYATLLAARERRDRTFVFIAWGFMLIQFRGFVTGGSLAMARYTLTDGALLTVLAGYGLWRLAQRFRLSSYKPLAIFTAAVMVVNLTAITLLSQIPNKYVDKFRSISPLLQYPEHVQEVARFLCPHLHASDVVVIDNYNDESNIVAAAIGYPLLPNKPLFLASQADPDTVWNYISAEKPGYAVLTSKGSLAPDIVIPGGCPVDVGVRGVEFRCVFQGELYRVFVLDYPNSPQNR